MTKMLIAYLLIIICKLLQFDHLCMANHAPLLCLLIYVPPLVRPLVFIVSSYFPSKSASISFFSFQYCIL